MVGELSLPPMEGVEAEEVQVSKAWQHRQVCQVFLLG